MVVIYRLFSRPLHSQIQQTLIHLQSRQPVSGPVLVQQAQNLVSLGVILLPVNRKFVGHIRRFWLFIFARLLLRWGLPTQQRIKHIVIIFCRVTALPGITNFTIVNHKIVRKRPHFHRGIFLINIQIIIPHIIIVCFNSKDDIPTVWRISLLKS